MTSPVQRISPAVARPLYGHSPISVATRVSRHFASSLLTSIIYIIYIWVELKFNICLSTLRHYSKDNVFEKRRKLMCVYKYFHKNSNR